MSVVISVLEGAKERLFETGWIKGDVGLEEGPNCLWGAVYFAAIGNPLVVREVCSCIGHVSQVGQYNISAFNDAPQTVFNDVIDVIDCAILMVKEQEREGEYRD